MRTASSLRLHSLWLTLGVFLIIVVIWASLTSDPPSTGFKFAYADKVSHLLAYAVLMGWFAQIFPARGTRQWLVIGFILMGVLLEYAQALTANRTYEVADMVANTLGVVLAWFLTRGAMGQLLFRFEQFVFSRQAS